MLYVVLILLFIGMCVALSMFGIWNRPTAGAVVVGVMCIAVGVLIEVFRFQQSQIVTKNQKQLFGFSGRTMLAGFLSMLLAAGYLVLGLGLLVLQAFAFFWS